MTLPYDVLRQRVQGELLRKGLTFAEEQLLNAAIERLGSVRSSTRISRETKRMLLDDEEENTTTATEQEQPAPAKAPKEKKVKRTASKVRAGGKKRNAAGKAVSKKKSAASATGRARSRIDPEAKIVRTSKDNPFRAESEAYKRVETVAKSSGQTASTIWKKPGIKRGSLATMKRLGLIEVK